MIVFEAVKIGEVLGPAAALIVGFCSMLAYLARSATDGAGIPGT